MGHRRRADVDDRGPEGERRRARPQVELPGEEEPLPLCRLRFTGVLHTWGFALYLASRGKYEDNFLPTGLPFGSPEDALDCACGFYLGDPTP
ncbi:hypothetical protein ABZT45_22425 [Streptomyces sp. NPDC005356]|uniref:hypothetical protein n=1 Tax=unclassified Streptomyces TaxID=2593676 RepID=UPI002250FB27|nr:hypothetical protein [Streptomyces sp. NBC_00120]MCX5320030.1 hypothetical protein [Streptomyces sp. NBC_00120]